MPEYASSDSLTYKGITELKSSNIFAIKIIDKGNAKLGKSYYARPYAIFENVEEQTSITVYGETINVNFPE